uniref:Zinc transporter ZIP6-like isoform X1 n=3 Tax=Crassostrea virginica TaxID=6565 RepID=A0A8B8DEP3_CRAVI|nr:zinc transporter ZIP6-like isoform X1 [Crassostrea virginica]
MMRRDKMCLPGGSRLCLVCLVVSVWRPVVGVNPGKESATEETTYPPLQHGHFQTTHDHNDLQIKQIHHLEIHKQGQFFYDRIMEKYGENGRLTLEGLKRIFYNIGLDSLKNNTTNVGLFSDHEHHDDHEHSAEHHDDHEHSAEHHDHDEIHKENTQNGILGISESPSPQKRKRRKISFEEISNDTCIRNPEELFNIYRIDKAQAISRSDFSDLCAGVLVMLDKTSCGGKTALETLGDEGHHKQSGHPHSLSVAADYNIGNIPGHVWGYSIIAVVIISLVGLLGVAVIPIMQKVFYNHLLQFLVALAVGALAGDALLHLFPHAFTNESHKHGHDESHAEESRQGVMKGLVGLLGVYMFFVMERLVTLFTNSKRKQKKKKLDEHRVHFANTSGEESPRSPSEPDCGTTMLRIHPSGKALENYAVESHKGECKLLMSANTDDQNNVEGKSHEHAVEEDTRSHVLDFSHGHSHSRCKTMPQTVAAIAWMVILGDGIHNFSDGLAIGAAFSNSITGGISTSIAVFCHELPHEIGDFAVLLRAGMTVKQAIIYNCVSSVLGFCGMLIGILVGNFGSSTLWIFACIGGIFIYIAFVDMLPELTSLGTKKGENPFFHLILQLCGLLLGSGIMFLIAIFEHDLMNLLEH